MTTRARTALVAILAVLALAAAGCGNSDSGSGEALEEALTFIPKDAPIVATIATDPDGGQWKQLDELAGKFPFAGQFKQGFKERVAQNSSLNFDEDIKPILGNDVVISIPTTEDAQRDGDNAVAALKVEDEGKAEDLIKKDSTKVATVDGTDIYRESGDTVLALVDGLLVTAPSQAELEAALKRHEGDDHMTTADLDARLAGLSGDGLFKLGINARQLMATNPDSAKARRIKWVGALRDVGLLVSAQSDGVSVDFATTSAGGLSDKDLPLAAGADAAPVVRRADEFGFGMRNLTQTILFAQAAAGATDPAGFGKYEAQKAKAGVKLGIDIDRDVIAQFSGDASVSVGIDGSFAVRSDLRDAAAFQRTLRTAAPKLPKLREKGDLGNVKIVVPSTPDGLYTLTSTDGKRYAFGVVDDKFVLATDAARATQFAAQSATAVPGAKGSLTMAADTRSLANAAAQRAGQGAAGLFTGALGDFVGSVDSETSGLRGHFKLNIK